MLLRFQELYDSFKNIVFDLRPESELIAERIDDARMPKASMKTLSVQQKGIKQLKRPECATEVKLNQKGALKIATTQIQNWETASVKLMDLNEMSDTLTRLPARKISRQDISHYTLAALVSTQEKLTQELPVEYGYRI